MRFKQLAIYSVALTLLILALVACGPADESIQREIGNLPSGTQTGSPQENSEEDEPTATPPPTICVAWPTQEAGDPDTMCLSPESMLPAPTPVYDGRPTPTPTLAPLPVEYRSTPGAMSGSPQAAIAPKALERVPREQIPENLIKEDHEAYEEIQSLVTGQNDFVGSFYRHLAQEGEGNLFYSPYSLYTAMGVVYAGAAGNTATEFQDVMGSGAPPDRFHRNMNTLDLTLLNDSVRPGAENSEAEGFRPTLSVANGLWIQDGLEVLPSFINTVTANYGIGLAQLDFRNSPDEAVAAINQWVDEATQGKIMQVISRDSITEFTSLVVTNAIYFKGDWEHKFSEELTTDEPFFLLDGQEVQTPLMFQRNDYGWQVDDGYQAVELPYKGNTFTLLVLMPDQGTFETFEQSLTGERLQAITDNLNWGEVILRMPRFKLDYSFSAKEGLQALGLADAFDKEHADFRPIAERLDGVPIPSIWIEDAVQTAFVEVNEEGSEAAAATAFSAEIQSEPPPPVEVTIDRPFIFLLRHSDTGAVLFMGRVLDPTR